MESGLTMVVHSVVLSGLLYLGLTYGLKQPQVKAVDRSVLVGGVLVVYMTLFGHGLPTRMNPNL
jgi:hypothetical protein